jgi:hypothetical protein
LGIFLSFFLGFNKSLAKLGAKIMHSSWLIDDVDSAKSMVRLRNTKTNLGKAYFFPRLKQAELKGTILFAHCEDGTWALDILTSVRKKINANTPSDSIHSASKDTVSHSGMQDIPYFLRKK